MQSAPDLYVPAGQGLGISTHGVLPPLLLLPAAQGWQYVAPESTGGKS